MSSWVFAREHGTCSILRFLYWIYHTFFFFFYFFFLFLFYFTFTLSSLSRKDDYRSSTRLIGFWTLLRAFYSHGNTFFFLDLDGYDMDMQYYYE